MPWICLVGGYMVVYVIVGTQSVSVEKIPTLLSILVFFSGVEMSRYQRSLCDELIKYGAFIFSTCQVLVSVRISIDGCIAVGDKVCS